MNVPASRQSGRANTAPLMIILFVGVIGAAVFLYIRLQNREESKKAAPEVVETVFNPETECQEFREAAEQAYSDFAKVKRSEVPGEKDAAFKNALDKLEEWDQKWQDATVELRDEEGAFKQEYNGYRSVDAKIQQLRGDLGKAAGL